VLGSTPLPAGTLIGGDYRVVRPLSAGGMGAVYVAEQLSTGKLRALKVMHAGLLQDSGLRARFTQEARVGSMLASAHVVEVIGAGVDEATHMPWLAMELLDGEDLASCVARRGCLPLDEAVPILKEACHALAAAHAGGVVHRDVKPENIFLARVQGVSVSVLVKVLDFGIAKILAAQSQTVSGLGTPMWMAPEQTLGGVDVGPPTDVWAIGLVTFWLLTGVYYWRTANNPSGSMPELLREINMLPLVPAQARAAELGAQDRLPPGFDGWFARCVVRDPGARFREAGEAMAALATVSLAFPPRATATSLPEASHPSDGPRSRRLAAGLAVFAVSGVAAFFFELHRESIPGASPVPTTIVAVSPAPSSSDATAPLPSGKGATDEPTPPTALDASLTSLGSGGGPPPPRTAPAAASRHVRPVASAAPRPFDHEAASKSIALIENQATFVCRLRPGPTSIRMDLTYSPSGVVTLVNVDPSIAATGTALCVTSLIHGSHIPPFDGPPQHVTASVGW